MRIEWRGGFENHEVNALHGECFNHPIVDDDWKRQLREHSLGWVCARHADALVGFVNVAWDGARHAFVLDTLVTAETRRHGLGTRLLAAVEAEARAAGCQWLHVDFDEHLGSFYFNCGFAPTTAGVIAL